MVRQLHLRTQGGQESSAAHPDVIGDRCVYEQEWSSVLQNVSTMNILNFFESLTPRKNQSGVSLNSEHFESSRMKKQGFLCVTN